MSGQDEGEWWIRKRHHDRVKRWWCGRGLNIWRLGRVSGDTFVIDPRVALRIPLMVSASSTWPYVIYDPYKLGQWNLNSMYMCTSSSVHYEHAGVCLGSKIRLNHAVIRSHCHVLKLNEVESIAHCRKVVETFPCNVDSCFESIP